jgi:hypothetical protein
MGYVGIPQDDPDMWANLTIIPASLIYFFYNVRILRHPELYSTDFFYYYGDILYFVNSLCYTVAALRDDGWFWFMPLAGQWSTSQEDFMIYEVIRVIATPKPRTPAVSPLRSDDRAASSPFRVTGRPDADRVECKTIAMMGGRVRLSVIKHDSR